ncbi:MAG: thioredoxin domain-containing protein [Nitrospinae bacterium]|nr:thioredoxin domain-containing protein [Nitrospinota bacterium]
MVKKPNALIHEASPYLLQHAMNPVEWYPWSEEAFKKAQEEDKPVFLSIGYSACHWCHVMEKESFEDEETAEVMNKYYINIKVDREERPDLDAIYMEAVINLTGSGGWPMSVFLTPEAKPFFGGTYFPPTPRHNLPAFKVVLQKIALFYHSKTDELIEQTDKLTKGIYTTASHEGKASLLSIKQIENAEKELKGYFDEYNGGFGNAPKFPQPMLLDFLLKRYKASGDSDLLNIVEKSLQKMAEGGIYDQVGGGFHRYSVDAEWLVPHFEKMLYDNAQLLTTYLHAWQITGKPFYKKVVGQTINYLLREMKSSAGGFFSTQDADSEGVEGKFFLWTKDEIIAVLGKEDAEIVAFILDVTEEGNFEGKNILNIVQSMEETAEMFSMEPKELEKLLDKTLDKLFHERKKRVHPFKDEKIIVEWNGLLISSLAKCGAALKNKEIIEAAEESARFILNNLLDKKNMLFRCYKDQKAYNYGCLEDYASCIVALLTLYKTTGKEEYLNQSLNLFAVLKEEFLDEEHGGFFQTGKNHEKLIARRKDFTDNAVPSGNSLTAEVLYLLFNITGEEQYEKMLKGIFSNIQEGLEKYPCGYGRLLSTLDAYLSPATTIVLVGKKEDHELNGFIEKINEAYAPYSILFIKDGEENKTGDIFQNREMVNNQTTAYLCSGNSCKEPTTSPEELLKQLNSHRFGGV